MVVGSLTEKNVFGSALDIFFFSLTFGPLLHYSGEAYQIRTSSCNILVFASKQTANREVHI